MGGTGKCFAGPLAFEVHLISPATAAGAENPADCVLPYCLSSGKSVTMVVRQRQRFSTGRANTWCERLRTGNLRPYGLSIAVRSLLGVFGDLRCHDECRIYPHPETRYAMAGMGHEDAFPPPRLSAG